MSFGWIKRPFQTRKRNKCNVEISTKQKWSTELGGSYIVTSPKEVMYFRNCTLKSLIIHEPKAKEISKVDDTRKSEEEMTIIMQNFTKIFSRNTAIVWEVQALASRTSSDFKTPQSSWKMLGFASQFQLLSVFGNRRKSSYSYLNYYFIHGKQAASTLDQRLGLRLTLALGFDDKSVALILRRLHAVVMMNSLSCICHWIELAKTECKFQELVFRGKNPYLWKLLTTFASFAAIIRHWSLADRLKFSLQLHILTLLEYPSSPLKELIPFFNKRSFQFVFNKILTSKRYLVDQKV